MTKILLGKVYITGYLFNSPKARRAQWSLTTLNSSRSLESAWTGLSWIWPSSSPGMYVCSKCDNPLFKSQSKYKHSTPWPAFTEPVTKESLKKYHETEMALKVRLIIFSQAVHKFVNTCSVHYLIGCLYNYIRLCTSFRSCTVHCKC